MMHPDHCIANAYFCTMKWTVFIWLALAMTTGSSLEAQPMRDLYQSSLNLYNSGKTEAALAELNRYIDAAPGSQKGIYLRAYIHLQEGEKEKALSDYTLLLKINPNHEGALTNRALILMEDNKYDEALRDLDRRVRLDTTNWKALYDRGYCKGLKDDNAGAISDFTKVIRLNPGYAEAYANRAYAKINELTNGGVIRPAPSQTADACEDLQTAKAMGDSSVVKMINLYCSEQ